MFKRLDEVQERVISVLNNLVATYALKHPNTEEEFRDSLDSSKGPELLPIQMQPIEIADAIKLLNEIEIVKQASDLRTS